MDAAGDALVRRHTHTSDRRAAPSDLFSATGEDGDKRPTPNAANSSPWCQPLYLVPSAVLLLLCTSSARESAGGRISYPNTTGHVSEDQGAMLYRKIAACEVYPALFPSPQDEGGRQPVSLAHHFTLKKSVSCCVAEWSGFTPTFLPCCVILPKSKINTMSPRTYRVYKKNADRLKISRFPESALGQLGPQNTGENKNVKYGVAYRLGQVKCILLKCRVLSACLRVTGRSPRTCRRHRNICIVSGWCHACKLN